MQLFLRRPKFSLFLHPIEAKSCSKLSHFPPLANYVANKKKVIKVQGNFLFSETFPERVKKEVCVIFPPGQGKRRRG